ncbi:RNA polymerase sigma factor [Desulfomonile tiedjei]|uniref:RNA polymerase sigma factor n=1 Tax=Desulfomonile tiedjei (strain ATCC 49306 / DSM 6799 / DCB-1) TaxID=706587 RepID=I4CDS2_DESTA|nr:sigma-70 family RNA polymerase sigma factor [Desulfomonile tiedjei]AFM27713.1 RNA polymerase sigma factor, sigma-70 family [Desulfomonile tiedjei DSM 6799]
MIPDSRKTDEELVAEAQKGSDLDFSILVDRHTNAVFRLAYGITRSTQEAEDIVQETFLKAFKHLDGFSPEKANFRTWLLTITRNQSINVFSALKRKTLRFVTSTDDDERDFDSAGNPHSACGNPEKVLTVKQEHKRVEQALAQLSERQRTALLLKAQESMSYEEIAAVMGASASSVESLIFRARKRLLEILKNLEK